MSQLPKGWESLAIRDVATYVQRGKSPRYCTESPLPVINQRCVRWWGIDEEHVKFVDPSQWDLWSKERFLSTGDILWNSTGTGTIGRAALFSGLVKYDRAVVDSHITIVRCGPRCIPKYLHYYIRSPDIQGRIEGMHAGSTNQVELSREEILRTLLPIPSTDEQRRIVAKLDSLFNHSKGARGELAPIPRLIDRYKRAVLAWATSGKLTADWRSCHTPMESGADFIRTNDRDRKAEHELQRRDAAGNGKRKSRRVTGASGPYVEVNGNHPKAWCLTRIRHIVECLDHLRVPINRSERANRNGPIPYYGANGPVGWIDDFLFDEDLVLVVEDETFIGRQKPFSYIIKGKTWVNNHAHVLRPLGGMTADFLNIVLSYYDFTPLTSGTTGRLKLTQEALLDAPILIPPPEEQTEIMRRVQAAFAYLERLQFEHTRAAALLNRLDQAALAKAFRGELVNSTPLEGQKAAKR